MNKLYESKLKYLQVIGKQFKTGKISEKKYNKLLKQFRSQHN